MNCAFCGVIFVRDRKKVGQGRQIYCGIDCAQDVSQIKGSYRYRQGDAVQRKAILDAAKQARAQSTQRAGQSSMRQ